MALSQLIKNNKENFSIYRYTGYNPDELSVFYFLVKNNQLQIEFVDTLTYHFFQIPGYIFSVKHFERNSPNVGWLIQNINICQYDLNNDTNYLNKTLNINNNFIKYLYTKPIIEK